MIEAEEILQVGGTEEELKRTRLSGGSVVR
jgi:hypothetical protein